MTDSKSVGSNTVRVRPPPSAPKSVTPLNEWGYIFYVLVGGRTRNLRVVHGCTMAVAQSRRKDAPTQTTAKARMPYKMNAQSFKQGCIKTATQSRYARMHKDSHTKPLHDATAQMAVDAQMQRHKWLSMHRCSGTNGCRCTDATTQTTANARMRDSACPKFRTMRNQQSKHDSTTPPRYTFAHSTSGVLFLARRVREPATCG